MTKLKVQTAPSVAQHTINTIDVGTWFYFRVEDIAPRLYVKISMNAFYVVESCEIVEFTEDDESRVRILDHVTINVEE